MILLAELEVVVGRNTFKPMQRGRFHKRDLKELFFLSRVTEGVIPHLQEVYKFSSFALYSRENSLN